MCEKTMQKAPKRHQKLENITPFDHFEHMMGICAGLVKPKSENVEKLMVFKTFLKETEGFLKVGRGWSGLDGPRPGGMRGAA